MTSLGGLFFLSRTLEVHGPALPALDRLALFGYLAQMVSVGIPLSRALQSIREQYPDGPTRAVVGGLRAHLSNGRSLSDAMGAFPSSFTRLQVGVVAAGERAGALPEACARLARHEERRLSLTRHVRALMVYPMVVFAAALLLIVGLAQVLLSGVAPLMAQSRVEMGFFSSAVLGCAAAMRDLRLLTVAAGAGAALVVLGRRWLSTEDGSAFRERVLLSLPVIGPLLRRIDTVHVCESLATLESCGVPLLEALEVTAHTAGLDASRGALSVVSREVRRGQTLSAGMGASGFFSRSVSQMVAVGEQSGALPRMLARVAEYQDLEVRTALEQFAAALEPFMIVGLGAVVAGIVLIAFAPLYRLIAVLG